MANSEPIEIVVARLDERTRGTAEDVADIKLHMATKNDQAHVDARILGLVGALEKEVAERVAGIATEKAERVAADQAEATARGKVAERLQVVEDRMEARKYTVMIAILTGGIGAIFGVVSALIQTGILGGG